MGHNFLCCVGNGIISQLIKMLKNAFVQLKVDVDYYLGRLCEEVTSYLILRLGLMGYKSVSLLQS